MATMCQAAQIAPSTTLGRERRPALLQGIDRVAGPADLFAECGDEEGGEEDEQCGEWKVRRRMRDVHRAHQA